MRIAIFTEVFLPKIDGIVTRITRTLDELAALGHEVVVFAPGNPVQSYAGFRVVTVPSVPFWPIYPENHVGALHPGIYRELRAFDPDVVHCVNPIWTAGWSALIAEKMGYPILASFHTDVPEYTRKLGIGWMRRPALWGIRTFHSRAKVNLVTSAPMLEKASDYGIDNVEVWPKAVDTVGFAPSKSEPAMRAMLSGGNPDDPLVTYVGRISAEKSTARTLGIMERVRERVPTARLALIGAGPQLEELRRTMDRDWITFTGYLSGAQLHSAYASGDVLLFPSTTETLGFAALEALASGVPVVGARAGGLPYVIDDGITGYTVDPQRSDAEWAGPVARLLTDAQARGEFSRAARAEAERWSWRSATQRLVEFYGAACAE
ncbi:glycosyltransferase family 4 protein [Corynebacterium liangguodongii]|uniref:Glycosyl transferase n=1 Tax=Corynebacterium liangguodongii TaxID=2079535 RepID=A0A2S0WD54_9CORY|nr:glycosyltransferase family 1 protein [Corynebacterium liangguodongii]AWB83699.1 glycosyl transferase [Corynebacterium liangguodongii]PWB99491.1 glycosyltransferase family 1 protein [Corynebacterium liangguodongii]